MKFSEKVRTLRENAGLTQRELSSLIGVSLRTVTNYESGERYPKQRKVYKKLAEVLNTDINYLLTEDEEFILSVSSLYGDRSAAEAKRILRETKALFAGGELSPDDARAFIDEIQKCYLDSKERAKKFAPNSGGRKERIKR